MEAENSETAFSVEIQRVERALSLFDHDENGAYLSGSFQDLALRIQMNKSLWRDGQQVPFLMARITDDIWNISTLVQRLELTRELTRTDKRIKGLWFYFARLDVDHFHMEYRAILDFVARIIGICAGSPGKMPNSFRRLILRKDKYQQSIPPSILALLGSVDWFWEIREVRDSLLHEGAWTAIFADPSDGVLFQVFKQRFPGLISKPFLLHNENVVYFDRYAALYLSWLITFLEDLAAAIMNNANLQTFPNVGGVHCYSSGFTILKTWMLDLLEQLRTWKGTSTPRQQREENAHGRG